MRAVIVMCGNVTCLDISSVNKYDDSHGSLKFLASFILITRFLERTFDRCVQFFVLFWFGGKTAVLKGSSRSRLSSKSTGISRKMEGENTIEKCLRAVRLKSMTVKIVAPRVQDSSTPEITIKYKN